MAQRTPVPEQFRTKQRNDAHTSEAEHVAQQPAPTTEPLATIPQRRFLHDLIDKRDLLKSPAFFDATNAMDAEELAAYIQSLHERIGKADDLNTGTLTKRQAHKWIDALKPLPNKEVPKKENGKAQAKYPKVADYPNVHAGRYALHAEGDELNPIHFFLVEVGRDYSKRGGRNWSDTFFLRRFAGDERYPVTTAQAKEVLAHIARDPLAAARLYGQEAKKCSQCNRNLTRRLSRYLGIGPVCGAKAHWLTEQMIAQAEDDLIAQGYDPKETVA